MDYQFYRDVTGRPIAECELGHFGDWLSHEIGDDMQAIQGLLANIVQLESKQKRRVVVNGKDYDLVLDQDEAELQFKTMLWQEDDELPEGTELDENLQIGCGLEDIKQLIEAWLDFLDPA
jgi:uncharacterized protein